MCSPALRGLQTMRLALLPQPGRNGSLELCTAIQACHDPRWCVLSLQITQTVADSGAGGFELSALGLGFDILILTVTGVLVCALLAGVKYCLNILLLIVFACSLCFTRNRNTSHSKVQSTLSRFTLTLVSGQFALILCSRQATHGR